MTDAVKITPLEAWVAGKVGVKGGRMTRQQLEAYQLARLNEIIAKVRNLSPFYRKHLAKAGSDCLTRLTDLTKYPLTAAADVTEYAMQMVCGSQSQISRVVTLATSGTTGNPKRVYFTGYDQELTIDFFRCGMSTLVGAGDKTLILLQGGRPGSVGNLLLKGLLLSGVEAVAYGLIQNLPDAVKKMCRERATCLVGVPVQILAMARYWEKWGQSNWTPRCALLSTDYVPNAIVAELRRIWHCEVYEHYGMTEMGLGGGLECAAHTGYHLREADLYFEIVDPVSTEPLPDGEYGEVVFTTLTRQGMPLLRYRTGDISRFITQLCPCGSILRRLERIRSRKGSEVYFGQNRMITLADLDEVLFLLPDVVNFNVMVNYSEQIRLKIVLEVLSDDQTLAESVVLSTIRQISAIQTAEQDGSLLLEAKVVPYSYMSSGKRSIIQASPTREGTQNAM